MNREELNERFKIFSREKKFSSQELVLGVHDEARREFLFGIRVQLEDECEEVANRNFPLARLVKRWYSEGEFFDVIILRVEITYEVL